jgi:hypothetical protein
MSHRGAKQKQNLEGPLCVSLKRFAGSDMTACGKRVAEFRDLAVADKSDREFYRKLSGQERLAALL